MAIVYPDKRRPVLVYNFTSQPAANEPRKCTQRIRGKAKVQRLARSLVNGMIRHSQKVTA